MPVFQKIQGDLPPGFLPGPKSPGFTPVFTFEKSLPPICHTALRQAFFKRKATTIQGMP